MDNKEMIAVVALVALASVLIRIIYVRYPTAQNLF